MAQKQETQHALLIPWGRFAQEIGLIAAIEAVELSQKVYAHTPQAKVLEFLVAILSGLKQLQEISLAAYPLDKDIAVAEAWGQAAWADYTGVSRTLKSLTWDEVRALVAVLEQVGQPFLAQELALMECLQYDGDLTGLPVSNTSKTYPNAAFGPMPDEIHLGYQAGVVSLQSPSYGRLWVSVEHHAGDTVSSTQAENLVLAAEKRTGQRPRRTELLKKRLDAFVASREPTEKRLEIQKAGLTQARQAYQAVLEQIQTAQEAPASKQKHLGVLERRGVRREKAAKVAQEKLGRTQTLLQSHFEKENELCQRLEQFEQENAENLNPVQCCFRLDAGFGTYENIALLIEMGYEVYVKLHNYKIVRMLKGQVVAAQSCGLCREAAWMRVGKNAEMVAWKDFQPENLPYPLDVALERFYTGETLKYSALAHFGDTSVTTDLDAWFGRYNARQTIEAGIKETKQVFYLHHLKVRSEPAIFLQEALTIFAANFIRWATIWIEQNADQDKRTLSIGKMGIKKQVQVAANTSAVVIQNSEGMLLRFSPASAFAGKQLFFSKPYQAVTSELFSAVFYISCADCAKVTLDNSHWQKSYSTSLSIYTGVQQWPSESRHTICPRRAFARQAYPAPTIPGQEPNERQPAGCHRASPQSALFQPGSSEAVFHQMNSPDWSSYARRA